MHRKIFFRFTSCALMMAGTIAFVAPSHAYRMIQNTKTGRVSAGAAVSCNAPGGFAHWNTARSLEADDPEALRCSESRY